MDQTTPQVSEKQTEVVAPEKPEEAGVVTQGDDYDETSEYVSGLPLAIIVTGLCLAVFLVALVSRILPLARMIDDIDYRSRTIPSLRQPFRESPITSTPSTMLAGTAAHIFLPPAPFS